MVLYTCAEDFFKKAAKQKRLSPAEEKLCVQKMKAGDLSAKQTLFDSYLPTLASLLKRIAPKPLSLELIYEGLVLLDDEVVLFDFQQEQITFPRHLERKIRWLMVRYIADRPS
jgi:DNA-directed RNA polymerase sigma subunit (sigma70/sigma32)